MSTPNSDPAIPDWALAYANAALKFGQSLPETQQQLLAKGLSVSVAAAVMNAVVESRMKATPALRGPRVDPLVMHRLTSAVVVCLCLVLAYMFNGGESVGRTVIMLLFPVVCIWWGEVFANGNPPEPARWVGWLVLLMVVGYRVLLLSLL